MLFNESEAPHLKGWIVRRLANDSDADADVLADYVLALLRHDDTTENIRTMFDEEIPDFLRDGATAFTDDVFQAIRYKSYMPGAPPAPPVVRQPSHQIHNSLQQLPNSQYQPQAPFPQNPVFPPFASAASRKRPLDDRDDDDDVNFILDSADPYYPTQPFKQARRGGRDFAPRGGRFDDGNGMRGSRGGHNPYQPPPGPAMGQYGQPPAYPSYPHAQNLPPVDPNSIMENIQRLQQLGIPIPQASDLPRPIYSGPALPPPRRRKGRCRDYDTKGYCSRGNRCMYEHGSEPVYMPPFGPSPADEYDPHNASLALGPFGLPPQSQAMPPLDMSMLQAGPTNRQPPNRQDFKRQKRPPKGRAPIAANGPVHDKTKSTIVVQHIPAEHFSEAEIRGYFSQFGDITGVTMQEPTRLAIIKYDSWDAANAAWSSPKVIFDNRFVKVFWYKDEADASSKGKATNGTKNGASNGETPNNENKEPEFDMEEFLLKQKEAQKAHEEKVRKREEMEKERQALEDRQKELLARQAEEKRKLQAKLARGGNGQSLSPTDGKSSNGEKPSTQAEALRAQLAALEEEANSLGIDPDAQDESYAWSPRGRGRGRRVYRGRGGFSPRAVYRGGYSYRGRGGGPEARHTAYAAYSLDLRPKIIAITGADFTIPEKDEALRQYLFGVGEFKEIHSDPTTTHITFKDRKTAEQFMFGVTAAAKNQIPSVEEKLELTWSTSAPATEKSNEAGAATTAAGGGTAATGGEDGGHDTLMARGLEDEDAAAKEKAGLGEGDGDGSAMVGGSLEDGEVDEGDDMDYEGIF